MARCLWCKAELVASSVTCPRCGRLQEEDLSLGESAGGGYAQASPSEAPPGRQAQAAAGGRSVSLGGLPLTSGSTAAASGAGGGAMFEADDLDGGPALETVSDWRKPPPLAPPPPPSAPSSGAGLRGDKGDRSKGASAKGRPSGGALPESQGDAEGPDRLEVVEFAAYGAAPTEWWQAPGYLYRVKMRQGALRTQLAERRGLAAKADDAEQDALASISERVVDRCRKLTEYADVLRALDAARDVLRSEDGALAAAMEAHAAKLASFDQRLGPLEHELSGAKADLEQLKTAEGRAEALHKRAEIEARNAASRSPKDGASAAEQLARAGAASAQAKDRLDAARRVTGDIQQRVLDAKNERAAIDAQFKRGGGQRTGGIDKARKAFRAAAAKVGDKALADSTFADELSPDVARVAHLRKDLASRARDVALCDEALLAYDQDVFRLGAMIVLGIAAVFLVLTLVAFYEMFLSSSGAPPAAPAPPIPSS